ncbi:MAG: hypothetical protein PHU95_06625 [Candidatus Thermoplasmatota archaeon]|nr:hypothetical protein [Candidatus Thermoplasmatota archaeon]
MKLIVSLTIGAAALGIMATVVFRPCLFPRGIYVEVVGNTVLQEGTDVPVTLQVLDDHGSPIEGATVTVTGLGTGDTGLSDHRGRVTLYLNVELGAHRREGYLDVEATAPGCYRRFHQNDLIKVIAR